MITKEGTNVTWAVDGLRIATVTTSKREISTNIFVGFFDVNATQTTANKELQFGLADNLVVEQIDLAQSPGAINITGISRSGANIQILFSAAVGAQNLVIEGSASVASGYVAEPNVQIESISAGPGNSTWRATIPITTSARFFRVRQ